MLKFSLYTLDELDKENKSVFGILNGMHLKNNQISFCQKHNHFQIAFNAYCLEISKNTKYRGKQYPQS